MKPRIGLAMTGDLVRALDEYKKQAAAAVTEAIDEAADDVQAGFRDQLVQAGLGRKLPRTIRKIRYPRGKKSLGAAALVYSKAPQVVQAFNAGSVILPKQGRYLAIPTQYNLNLGRRRNPRSATWDGVRVKPEEMIKSGASFVIDNKGGRGKLWMLTVATAQLRREATSKKTGRKTYYGGRILAYAGGLVQIGSGRRSRVDAALQAGAVPMFTLLPNVRLTKRLDIARLRSAAERRLPRLIRYKLDRIGDAP